MFDIGWQELFVVAAITILVVGPRDLPRVLKSVMGYVRKAKSMAREFQDGVDDVVREVELDDIRKEANSIATMDIDAEIKNAVDPTGSLDKDLDMADVEKNMQETASEMNEASARTDESITHAGGSKTFGHGDPDAAPEVLAETPAPEPAYEPAPADTPAAKLPEKEASS